MLAEGYYEKENSEIIDSYLDIEPLLVACSELCGFKVISLDEIVKTYKKQLS